MSNQTRRSMGRIYAEGSSYEAAATGRWHEPKWYVLFVRSKQEWCVAQHLSYRAIEYCLPTYQRLRQWRDRKVRLVTPLFPGYVFVRLALANRLTALLIPNVVRFVGTENCPSVMSDDEIEWIRRGVTHGKAEPHPYLNLKSGDTVVIKAGAMAGMEGVLVRTQNGARVLIQLESLSRAFTVEVDRNWVAGVTDRAMEAAC